MNISKLKYKLKDVVEKLPYSFGRFIALLPNAIFFGQGYGVHRKNLLRINSLDKQATKEYLYNRVKRIINYAYQDIEFYKRHFSKNEFNPENLKSFEDLKKTPIVRKEDFQQFPLKKRSKIEEGIKINTGGTSGEPLEFYVESDAFTREWAHMLEIWSKLGYKRTDLKLTFRGKNLGDQPLKYNAIGNEYLVNAYQSHALICEALEELLKKRTIKFIHGYPSSIYEFAKYVKEHSSEIKSKLNKSLKGILLGSEFPAPVYRDLINEVFKVPDMSWYGHSEMCVLAYEKNEKWKYEPMMTYGYCEAIPDSNGEYHLIGTSYHNYASPFIRYDTGDIIKPEFEEGLLKSFKVSKGRTGEYVQDKNGHKISLTALIFGRHHEIFSKAKFIQISQHKPGEATVFVTPSNNEELSIEEIKKKFDSSNVSIDFKYQLIDRPFRTASGKTPLLVRN